MIIAAAIGLILMLLFAIRYGTALTECRVNNKLRKILIPMICFGVIVGSMSFILTSLLEANVLLEVISACLLILVSLLYRRYLMTKPQDCDGGKQSDILTETHANFRSVLFGMWAIIPFITALVNHLAEPCTQNSVSSFLCSMAASFGNTLGDKAATLVITLVGSVVGIVFFNRRK